MERCVTVKYVLWAVGFYIAFKLYEAYILLYRMSDYLTQGVRN